MTKNVYFEVIFASFCKGLNGWIWSPLLFDLFVQKLRQQVRVLQLNYSMNSQHYSYVHGTSNSSCHIVVTESQ